MKNIKKNAQSLIEYGLILALIAVIAITVLSKFSSSINKTSQSDSDINGGTEALINYCKSINKVFDPNSGTCK